MKIRIVTDIADLATPMSEWLEEQGYEVEHRPQTVRTCVIRYAEGCATEDITGLVNAIKPLLPSVTVSEDLEGVDAELLLGDTKPLSDWDIKINADSELVSQKIRDALVPLGFSDDGGSVAQQDKDQLQYGGASLFARQVVRWFLARNGIRVSEKKEWGDGDNDIWLFLRDPTYEGMDLKEVFPVEICGDNYALMLDFTKLLEARGFKQVSMRGLDEEQAPRFMVRAGPFARDASVRDELREVLEHFLEECEVDQDRYPLEVDVASTSNAQILLPIGAHEEGTLAPYTGAFPDRWDVVIRTDNRDAVESLVEELEEAGYTRVRVTPLPRTAFGFRIRWGAAAHQPEVAEFLKERVEELMEELDASTGWSLSMSDDLDDADPTIEIEIPVEGISDGTLIERVKASASEWELSFKTSRPTDFEPVLAELEAYGWKEFSRDTESATEAVIKYGGAPPALVEHVAEVIFRHTGVRLATRKVWGNDDDDLWVYVPDVDQPLMSEEPTTEVDLAAWFPVDEDAAIRPFLDVGAELLRIGYVTLRRNRQAKGPMVADHGLFAHYCIDQQTAETMLHVAESVTLREPCLLEGETSVSKTSVIQFLASLLNQPLVRLNLNGQTDTGELVGRFVPQNVAADLPVRPEELMASADLLEPESRLILNRAADEQRVLTRVEVQQIMANERMSTHPWRWQDGLVVSAMKNGWWIVLDELNLAEPQILERLNSVLERYPSIVLTEFDNSVIGSGGTPVHPNFRIFATMNPAEYAGRSALSPAYRDRWRGYRYVPLPGEVEYHAMLHFLVHGRQPEVTVRGVNYSGGQADPPLAVLAQMPRIDTFLRRLARFHAALEGAVGRTGSGARLGGKRRERYVFTRRGLLAVTDYLVSVLALETDDPIKAMRISLLRYYLGRVATAQDRSVVVQLLDAAGIGPNTWDLDTEAWPMRGSGDEE